MKYQLEGVDGGTTRRVVRWDDNEGETQKDAVTVGYLNWPGNNTPGGAYNVAWLDPDGGPSRSLGEYVSLHHAAAVLCHYDEATESDRHAAFPDE